MRKISIFILSIVLFCSCIETPVQYNDDVDHDGDQVNHIHSFSYGKHQYLQFCLTDSKCVIHDPDCKCDGSTSSKIR